MSYCNTVLNGCCNTVLNIGIVNACESSHVVIPATAPAPGVYSLVIQYLNKLIKATHSFSIHDPMVFTFTGLNENFTYSGWIEDSSGNRLSVNTYDCIEFETKCFDIDES